MSRHADLCIYYGEARFILPVDDPRTAEVLAILLRDLPPPPKDGVAVPKTDAEFLAVARRYFGRPR